MHAIEYTPALYVRKVRGMGRGVFAGRPFRTNEVIEICPVLPLPEGTTDETMGPLAKYVFQWGEKGFAVAFGYGSLYNHSSTPNTWFNPRLSRNDIIFRALRDIAVDEQLFIDYKWDEADLAALRKPKNS